MLDGDSSFHGVWGNFIRFSEIKYRLSNLLDSFEIEDLVLSAYLGKAIDPEDEDAPQDKEDEAGMLAHRLICLLATRCRLLSFLISSVFHFYKLIYLNYK